MKKIILAAIFIALTSCSNTKPVDYSKYVDLETPFDFSTKTREKNYIFLPSYRTDIETEQDYKLTQLECRSLMIKNNDKSDYCLSELRWRRNFGDLQFLDKPSKEKKQ